MSSNTFGLKSKSIRKSFERLLRAYFITLINIEIRYKKVKKLFFRKNRFKRIIKTKKMKVNDYKELRFTNL